MSTKYNIRESKTDHTSAYQDIADNPFLQVLYQKIIHHMEVNRCYLEPGYSAGQLADELGTNTRYISASIRRYSNRNYSQLINEYRTREAIRLMNSEAFAQCTMEEIAHKAGYSNRQSFYIAFYRFLGVTPKQYQTLQK